MANPTSVLGYIETLAGVEPPTDSTAFSTNHYTHSQSVRFFAGKPEKKGGYKSLDISGGVGISGSCRSIFSSIINGKVYTMFGTNTRLYVLIGSTLTNITPLDNDVTVAAANSLTTQFNTLVNNPISTTNLSNVVRVLDADSSRFRVGDAVTLSGSSAVGGISAPNINGTKIVRTIGVGYWEFRSNTNATSTATGGGAAVVRSSGLVRVTSANTKLEGDRVKIMNAAAFGGITAPQMNAEFIARNVTSTYFDVMTTGVSTSSVTAAGGAGTTYYNQIAAGQADESFGQGYGMGFYGVGLYGVSKTSSKGRRYPRIWFFDRYGDYIVMTPGNGGKAYFWDGSLVAAPAQITNAPTQINYLFVSDNIIVTFGNNGIENRITASDQSNMTGWSGGAETQFYDDAIEGAGRLVSHIQVQGLNLIFTEQRVYTFRYIGLPNVWEVELLGRTGIIAPLAGVEVNNIAKWMGLDNFYQWTGGNVEIIPSNSGLHSTCLRYTFDDINNSQKSKSFAWYNESYGEVSFHYPSSGANEPDRQTQNNVSEKTWWPDMVSRTAVEKPDINFTYPKMVSGPSIYQHEYGTDADSLPLSFTLTTNLRTLSKKETKMSAFIPDSRQSGTINVSINMQQWPQSEADINSGNYNITPTHPRQEVTLNGRFWDYTFSGSELGQYWEMGRWGEEKQESGDGK